MLEQPEVLLRRPEEHRHLIERHTSRCLVQDPSRDLHGFTPFAGRGKETHVASTLASFRTPGREHEPAQVPQI
jgi:hypothetical protein